MRFAIPLTIKQRVRSLSFLAISVWYWCWQDRFFRNPIFAVNGFTLSLARELGPKGIRVNAVAPGITNTDMMQAVPKEVIEPMIAQIPLRRMGEPEDIANAVVFLASEKASYITGVVLSVDGLARS